MFAPYLYKKAPESDRRGFIKREKEAGKTSAEAARSKNTTTTTMATGAKPKEHADPLYGEHQRTEALVAKVNRVISPARLRQVD